MKRMRVNLKLISLILMVELSGPIIAAEIGGQTPIKFDRVIGQGCYRPIFLGDSGNRLTRILTAERRLPNSSSLQNVLIELGIDGEPSKEIVISNLPESDFRAAGTVAISEGEFILVGTSSSGTVLASVDGQGKVSKTNLLDGQINFRGVLRLSREQALIYGAKSGKPFFALIGRNLAVLKERQIKIRKPFGVIVRAEYDQTAKSLTMILQATDDASFSQTEISIVRADLEGRVVASYSVPGFLGDFAKTKDGIGLLYYGNNNNHQSIKLEFLSNKLKKKWRQEVIDAQYGVIWPRILSPDGKELIAIAGHGLKLYMVAYTLDAEKRWNYWDAASINAPAFTYFVMAQDNRLMLLQESKDETQKYRVDGVSCSQIRALGF